MEKVRLGIIGVGNMGVPVSKLIAFEGECPELEVTAICDISEERRNWATNTFAEKNVKIFADAEEMMTSGLVDAVYIAVPHYDHPTLAKLAFKHKLHVMCEKPAGVYTKAVREMNEAAKEAGVKFGIMFQCRTIPVFKKVKQMLSSGEFGQIRGVTWLVTSWYRSQSYYDSGSWRATWAGEGGGVLLNQCPHQLDLWQWICGMPKKVQAHLHFGKWHDIEVEDDVTAYVEYENGATGVFVTTTGDGRGSNRLEIQMDKAKFIVENGKLIMDEFEMFEPEFSATNTEVFGSLKGEIKEVETDGENPQHIGVLNAWGGAILRGEKLVAHGSEGINGLMLSNAMHLSAFLDKAVELPIDEDLYYEELMKRVKTSRKKDGVKAVFADTSNTYGDPKKQKMIEEHYKLK